MEINIKPNTYVQPTECRMEVVQQICEALLDHNAFSCIEMDGYPHPTTWVYCDKNTHKGIGFSDGKDSYYKDRREYTKMRTCEVQKAFDELIAAGYYIFKTGQSYHVYHKPVFTDWRGAVRCTKFNHFID